MGIGLYRLGQAVRQVTFVCCVLDDGHDQIIVETNPLDTFHHLQMRDTELPFEEKRGQHGVDTMTVKDGSSIA